jgi:hypothetical protein
MARGAAQGSNGRKISIAAATVHGARALRGLSQEHMSA